MAGGAADCSFWGRDLGMRCRMYELRTGERTRRVPVASQHTLQLQGYGTVLWYDGMWMGSRGDPQLYYVDSDEPS